MRLVTYSLDGGAPAAGIVLDGSVVNLQGIGYGDVISFLRDGDAAIEKAKSLFAGAGAPKLEDVKLHAPVPKPDKFICIGLNYRDHAIESGMDIPELPTVFTKYPNAVCGHDDDVVLPSVSKQVDYEAEFAFVIGKRCKNVPKEDWKDVVFGYTIVHDVSARDYQLATSQWTIGKTFDTFGPMGPTLVSKDEIEDPHNLRISLDLNGKTLQDSNTSQFVFDIPYLVNYLSTVMTLEPGDVISTGTPPGVGFARKPPIFMQPGDEAVVKIEGLGELRNRCVAD
jgi:2-keto-4-pentenoate hydratase/2-oxohepta-3-ene-1,7-dioic acid hydratase in catechol pathway